MRDSVAFSNSIGLGTVGFDCAVPGARNPCFVANQAKIQAGYTVGGGLEYAAWTNVTLKLEYLYVNLGSSNATATSLSTPVATPASFQAHFNDLTFNVVRAGFNYRF